ncbi:MAG TPA: DoxX family protein [Burkholderiales bacterium]|jgi:putative oxidoreductase|nr:DoxX family protein [Burkholderiales bacterium]
MEMVKQYGPPIGRILLALIFIISGVGKITGFEGTVGYMQAYNVPATQVLLVIAIIVELGGGILVAIGWQTRWASAALAVFVIIVTPIFHAFWAVPEDQAMMQQIQFLKNVSILGGLLYVMAHGPGKWAAEKG